MPPYPGAVGAIVSAKSNLSPIALNQGESHYVFGLLSSTATQLPINDGNVVTELPAGAIATSIVSSIAVSLQKGAEGNPPPMVCVEIYFPTAPGANESIAVQEADTDADGFYLTPTYATYTITVFTQIGASGQYVARADLSPTGGKFMRVQRTVGANAVKCTVKLTRLA